MDLFSDDIGMPEVCGVGVPEVNRLNGSPVCCEGTVMGPDLLLLGEATDKLVWRSEVLGWLGEATDTLVWRREVLEWLA